MGTHRWPGNVRELVHRLERAVVLSEHDVLGLEDVADVGAVPVDVAAPGALPDLARMVQAGLTLHDVERLFVRAVFDAAGGNKAEAARRLAVDRKTLARKLEDGEGMGD
jgi:DNA-binding NtrC family response regulator